MGSSDPATNDALPTESGVVVPLGSCWSRALMTGAAARVCHVVPTNTPRRGRNDSSGGAELAR
jgi:hypothetical protein